MSDDFLERTSTELAGWADPMARLRRALEKNEFALFCQPVLALEGPERYPLGEVLVRLREDERSLLPPGEFLPLLEHYGMMPQLDRWVIRHVIKRLASGSRLPRFSVNVSRQTLEDTEFPHFIAAELAARSVPSSALVFEIDESDALERAQAAARFSDAIKAQGGAIAIDGFGRRAVSFAPLKTLRVDFVKVDGSITRKILTSEVARKRITAIVRACALLRAGVIAECVEEQDVLVRLKAIGTGYAQGFGVYQPHPIDAVASGTS